MQFDRNVGESGWKKEVRNGDFAGVPGRNWLKRGKPIFSRARLEKSGTLRRVFW